jgi:hypothetical protein
MTDPQIQVDTGLLRADARKWDEIAATFASGLDILHNNCGVGLWHLDSVSQTTQWQHEWVEAKVELVNFAYRGKDRIGGALSLGIAGVGDVLRAMADAYDATDDDTAVTFQQGWEAAGGTA